MSLEIGRKITTDTGSHLVLTSSPVLFTSQAEMREQLLCLTRTAERQLVFWSRDLNSGLFKSATFLDVVKRFVLARRNAKVRILTLPFAEHSKLEHPLLLMAGRMPHCFQIRTTATCCLEAAELLMADERGVLYRIQADRWDGMANIYDPMVARFYRVQFDTAWNAAQSPVSLEQSVSL